MVQKRIDELARGRFLCTEPAHIFSTDRIEIVVLEGRNYQGEFEIKSKDSVSFEGRIYSSSPRMECLTPQFEGDCVRIRYEFHSEGLFEGDIQKGDFFIICSQAEYNLSFVVTVSRLYADTSIGPVKNLHDFTKLAQVNWGEARKIFYSSGFKNIPGGRDSGRLLLYEGLAKGKPTDFNMEEFLLACGCKQKVMCSADVSELSFYEVSEQSKYQVVLKKSCWGYTEFSVVSDEDFILPEKKQILGTDFVGSVCKVNYFILPDRMHAGKNFGSLVLENVNQRIVVNICASKGSGKPHNPVGREIKKFQSSLLNLYIDFRLKKMVTGKWAKASIQVLEELAVRCPGEVWYRLMKAQIFLMNGQRQEAEWLLNDFRREWKDKKTPQWGYYLYICTFMEREESYVDKLTAEIEQIYSEHSENPILFWCLLFLREEYTGNPSQALKALEYRVRDGHASPLLYVESYCLFSQDPYLLRHLGEFELKVFHWARKRKVLNAKLAEQLLAVLPERTEYGRNLFLLLESCYRLKEDERSLSIVCGYLIKQQKYGKEFFPWYEKGVEQNLRITGLYEAYLMSMDAESIMEVPKIILMYFKYNSQLDYHKKAALYVNIIANRERRPEDYEHYRQAMEVFAYEQMEAGHMDDNLAVIYNDVVRNGVHSQKLADVLSNVLFIHKLTCRDKNALRVIVTDSALRHQQVAPVIGGVAYFKLYSNEYSIFIEDHKGNRYSGSISYQLEKLMYPARYIRDCMFYAPGQIAYVLSYFSARKAVEYFEEKDLESFRLVMNSGEVSESYQSWLCAKMIRLLHELGNTGEINLCLEKIDYGKMTGEERKYLLGVLTGRQLYEQVYQLGAEYGREACSVFGWSKCVSHEISRTDFMENEALLKFAGEVFFLDEYDYVITEYLCRYYEGSTKRMEAVWKAAREMGIEAHELEERILTQMLYTGEFIDLAADIYDSYEAQGEPLLKKAYLNYFSYNDFVKDMVPPDRFFSKLKKEYSVERDLPMVCELSLLRHLLENQKQGETEEGLIETLLSKYVYQGILFSFYSKCSDKLKKKYQIYDKSFAEYKSAPHKTVQIRYMSGENQDVYVTEEMTEMYEGIYVKEFILFYGESIQYYISEKREGQMVATTSGIISGGEPENPKEAGRYGKLNELLCLREEKDGARLADKMRFYRKLLEKTEQTFTIM